MPATAPPQVQQTPVVPGEQYRPRHVKVQTGPDRWAHHGTLDARGAHRACPASRFNSRETCAACQRPPPEGVGTPRSLSAAAMPFRLVIPAARSSATIGARSAAVRLARADRAMSAVFGARWPKWRPVDIAAVCQSHINGSEALAASGATCAGPVPPSRAALAARDGEPPRLVVRQDFRLPRLGLDLPRAEVGKRLPVGGIAAGHLVGARHGTGSGVFELTAHSPVHSIVTMLAGALVWPRPRRSWSTLRG
jgi:hypothetical protein